jgi:hypothetical protein
MDRGREITIGTGVGTILGKDAKGWIFSNVGNHPNTGNIASEQRGLVLPL